MLLWVGQNSLSARFRLGIVVGVALNIAWTLLTPNVMQSGHSTSSSSSTTNGSGSGSKNSGGDDTIPIGLPPGGEII
jgi:hypothetical protein